MKVQIGLLAGGLAIAAAVAWAEFKPATKTVTVVPVSSPSALATNSQSAKPAQTAIVKNPQPAIKQPRGGEESHGGENEGGFFGEGDD